MMNFKSTHRLNYVSSPVPPVKVFHIKVKLAAHPFSAIKGGSNSPDSQASTQASKKPSLVFPQPQVVKIAPDDFIEPFANLLIPSTHEYLVFSKHEAGISVARALEKKFVSGKRVSKSVQQLKAVKSR